MFTIYLISTHLAPLETLNENTSNFRLLIAVADLMANGGWMDVATNSRLGYDHDRYDFQGRTSKMKSPCTFSLYRLELAAM